jgi:hypothetical protein
MHTIGRARRSRLDGSERRATRKKKKLKKAVGPTMEARKTKTLGKIDDSESDINDSNVGLSRRNTTPTMPKHHMI